MVEKACIVLENTCIHKQNVRRNINVVGSSSENSKQNVEHVVENRGKEVISV